MRFKSFKFFWNVHKWMGLVIALIVTVTSITGFLLLLKKRVEWIQPATRVGAEGGPESFISIGRLFEIVLAQGHADFRSADDVERVDLRPEKRVYKVRSHHRYAEMQVCAVTGAVLNVSWRPSDLLEEIHDGQIVAAWWHDWMMPAVGVALLAMVVTGLWLWIEPKVRRRRRLRAQAAARVARQGPPPPVR